MGAAGGLLEGKGDGMFDILAALRLGTGSAATTPGAAAAAEKLLENAAKVLTVQIEIFDADAGTALPGSSLAAGCAAKTSESDPPRRRALRLRRRVRTHHNFFVYPDRRGFRRLPGLL